MFNPSAAPSPAALSAADPWRRHPSAWGMGPDDGEAVLYPGFLKRVFYTNPGPGGFGAPWQRHDSPAERALFDRAHVILDNPSSTRTTASAFAMLQHELPLNALAGARNRLILERRELEYARSLLGIKGPVGELGRRKPRTWRVFPADANSDAAHIQIDNGQTYKEARGRFLRSLGFAAEPPEFDRERAELEYARALVAARALIGLRDTSGRIAEAPRRKKEGKTLYIPPPPREEPPEEPQAPAGSSSKPKPTFNLDIARRFKGALDRMESGGKPADQEPAPQGHNTTAASDPQLLVELEALEVQAVQPGALPLSGLHSSLAKARTLAASRLLIPADRARAQRVVEALFAELLRRAGEASPSTAGASSAPPPPGPSMADCNGWRAFARSLAESLLAEEDSAWHLAPAAELRRAIAMLNIVLEVAFEWKKDCREFKSFLPQEPILSLEEEQRLKGMYDQLRTEAFRRLIDLPSQEEVKALYEELQRGGVPQPSQAQPPSAQPSPTPPALSPDEAATMESIRDLMIQGEELGLSNEELRDLIADQVGQRSPGIFRRLWDWLADLFSGDDNGSGGNGSGGNPPALPAPRDEGSSGAAPSSADTMGAGPEEEAGSGLFGFIDRTQNRAVTVLKIVAVGAGIIILGWLIAAAYAVPKVVAAIAPAAGDVARTAVQSGAALQATAVKAAADNIDKIAPLFTGGAAAPLAAAAALPA